MIDLDHSNLQSIPNMNTLPCRQKGLHFLNIKENTEQNRQ